MSEHSSTPWTFQRAPKPTDGQYDCAVAAVINGERQIIAETFGRAASDVFPDSQANAAFIVKAVNSHDALVKALEKVEPFLSYGDSAEGRLKQIVRDALAAVGDPQRGKIGTDQS